MSISRPQVILVLCSILVVGLDAQGPETVIPNKETHPTVAGDTGDLRIWPEGKEGRLEEKSHDERVESSLDKTQMENVKREDKPSDNVISIEHTGTDKFHVDKSESSGVHTPASSVINDNSRKMAPPAETRDHEEDIGVQSEERTFPSKLSDLSPSERKKVLSSLEASFLNVVGLSSRPTPDKSVSVPQYMLDLYQKHIQSHEGRKSRSRYHRGLHNSNTIRSYFHTDEDNNLPENIARLKFNVTSLPGHEELRAAELRLYREASSIENQGHLANMSSSKLYDILQSRHRIDIHQITLPSRRTTEREAVTRLLDTRVVDPTKSGWEIFDVTPAVDTWRTDSKNYGLEVRISKESGERSSLRHVRLKRSTASNTVPTENTDASVRNWNSQEPLLVTYSDDRAGSDTTKHRSKRDARRNRDTRRKRNSKNKDRRKKRKDRPRKDRDYKKNCRRRPLSVDFHDVGWTDWIVAPPGYEAFYCYGECPFHLAEHFNTTNHAVVQQFVHSVDPAAVPKACCVPTELSEVALLYIDEENNVVLRMYEDMVVEACGCR